jgi:hypothetical protein
VCVTMSRKGSHGRKILLDLGNIDACFIARVCGSQSTIITLDTPCILSVTLLGYSDALNF